MNDQDDPRQLSQAADTAVSNAATDKGDSPSGGVLDPLDRLTELLYGIILVLTFTGTLRVAAQGRDDVYSTLWAAVGCSLAWGLVDASMYVLGCLTSRNHSYQFVRTLRDDPDSGRQQVAAAMPAVVYQALSQAEWDKMLASLASIPVPPRARVARDDVLGGVAIFLLANAALLPLAAPFALITDIDLAQHVSNGLALAMLFACGYKLARYTGERPWKLALAFVVFGSLLIAITIALGG